MVRPCILDLGIRTSIPPFPPGFHHIAQRDDDDRSDSEVENPGHFFNPISELKSPRLLKDDPFKTSEEVDGEHRRGRLEHVSRSCRCDRRDRAGTWSLNEGCPPFRLAAGFTEAVAQPEGSAGGQDPLERPILAPYCRVHSEHLQCHGPPCPKS